MSSPVVLRTRRRYTRACHAGIARALAAELPSCDADAVFGHFLAAGDLDSAKAVVVAAAEAADRGLAFMRAVQLYREAIRLHAAPQAILHHRLGDAYANAEKLGDAADAYLAGASHAAGGEALELRRLAAEDYLKSGRDGRGLSVLRAVLDEVGIPYPRSPERALASFFWHEAKLRLSPLRQRLRAAQSVSAADLARIDVAFSASTGLLLSDPLRAADYASRGLLHALGQRADRATIARRIVGLMLGAGSATHDEQSSQRG